MFFVVNVDAASSQLYFAFCRVFRERKICSPKSRSDEMIEKEIQFIQRT